MADKQDISTLTVGGNQFDNLGLYGVPMKVSDYTAENMIILIGNKKRPYHLSPLPREIQDKILNYAPDYMDRVMGIIYLKDPEKESFIRDDMLLTEIRGRQESLDYLTKVIDLATSDPDTTVAPVKSAPTPPSAQGDK